MLAQGGYRYLRIVVEMQGAEGRLVPLLAHELQHAVEIAQSPDARDAEGLENVFRRLTIPSGCHDRRCYETQAAKDVEHVVMNELRAIKH